MKNTEVALSIDQLIANAKKKAPTVEEWLNRVDYSGMARYVPSDFAMEMMVMIKMIHGEEGTSNTSPEVHLKVLDNFVTEKSHVVNMMHRGFGKSTLIKYFFFFLAIYGELPNFGKVTFALYVSDTMENGIAVMRKDLDSMWDNSPFLQKMLPGKKTTEDRWCFTNVKGKTFVIKGFGAKSGIRGTREQGNRPQIAVLDDLLSDDDARSPTVLRTIKDTVNRAVEFALDPTAHKVLWMGTPFHAGDPLYEAVESGQWEVNVYPVCESFPVDEKDFRGSWPSRFGYSYVRDQYIKAIGTGEIASFNQELMLRIMSEEDRLIFDADIRRFDRNDIMNNLSSFNIYITTDIATTEKQSADFTFLSVWAVNYNQDHFWIDGICERQTIDKTFEDIFRLNQKYKPMSVGIEVAGQQEGFISLMQREMSRRNQYFNLASQGNSNRPGIRPGHNKLQRFNNVVPLFKGGKMYFPENVNTQSAQKALNEIILELSLACVGGFKSKHDDALDTVSMLSQMNIYFPDEVVEIGEVDGIYQRKTKHDDFVNSYVV